jgi:hypothetical protein
MYITKKFIKWFTISVINFFTITVISTRGNATTETKIVDSQSNLNNAVNEEVPVKRAMPLEINDKSYDVTKWVSFADDCNSKLFNDCNSKPFNDCNIKLFNHYNSKLFNDCNSKPFNDCNIKLFNHCIK